MMQGVFLGGHPRVQLTFPGQTGPLHIQFIIDTGFDGDFAIPPELVDRIDSQFAGSRKRLLADGSVTQCPCFEMAWDDGSEEGRLVELLVLNGNPLIGTQLLTDHLLQVEVFEGGSVLVEAL